MNEEFYCMIKDKVYGPLSSQELRMAAKKGQLTSGDAVKKGKAGKWVAASKVRGLFPESPVWDFYACPVRNAQDSHWPLEKRENLIGPERGVPSYKKKVLACFACPAGCIPFSEIEEGKYKGTKGLGYWINSVWYSARLDVDDAAASLKFHLTANQLGLDGDAAATVISWAFECYQ